MAIVDSKIDIASTHFQSAAEALQEIVQAVDALPYGVEITDVECGLNAVGEAVDAFWEWSFRVGSVVPDLSGSTYPPAGRDRHNRVVAEVMRQISESYAREVERAERQWAGLRDVGLVGLGEDLRRAMTDTQADDAAHLYSPEPEVEIDDSFLDEVRKELLPDATDLRDEVADLEAQEREYFRLGGEDPWPRDDQGRIVPPPDEPF